jgi:acyl-CoA thioester hydrolase
MEVGRVELCKALGFNYRDMERDDGIYLMVAEANCRYSAPARFEDEVIIRTWVEDANPRVVQFAYEMRRAEDGRKLATGFTRHLFSGREMRRVRLPERYWAFFGIA